MCSKFGLGLRAKPGDALAGRVNKRSHTNRKRCHEITEPLHSSRPYISWGLNISLSSLPYYSDLTISWSWPFFYPLGIQNLYCRTTTVRCRVTTNWPCRPCIQCTAHCQAAEPTCVSNPHMSVDQPAPHCGEE